MKQLTFLSLIATLTLVLSGCSDDVNCLEDPDDPDCVAACMDDPTAPACLDMSTPDAGPDMGTDRCGGCGTDQVCDTASEMCVDCLGDGDCSDDVCLIDDANSTNNACVACIDGDDCGGDTPVCTDENTCVGCVGNGDCSDPDNGQCNTETNTCVPCDDSVQCTEDGAGVCNDGTCVQCSADDETACGDDVCDVSAETCTTTPAGMTGLCQECVSDRQCSPGRVCVPMTFNATDVGSFCLWRLDATEVGGPMGSCTNSLPYRGSEEVTTVSGGDPVSICSLRNTTCAALADFDTADCATPGISDDECGIAGLDDGLCRMVDAVVNRCTIPCDSNDDCRSGGCNLGETPPFCNF